jgi:hypothetical protein
MIKLEIVVSVWDDGLFKHRVRRECSSDNLEEKIEIVVSETQEKIKMIQEEHNKRYIVDDDIPF